MNKADLVGKIAQDVSLSKADAEKTLCSVLNGISDALKSGDSVTLVGFGTFSVRERAARKGPEPKDRRGNRYPGEKGGQIQSW